MQQGGGANAPYKGNIMIGVVRKLKGVIYEKKADGFNEEGVSLPILCRIFLWKGVIRRFFLSSFRKKYIDKNSLKRQGECLRCGACCKLVVNKCPYLKTETHEKCSCVKHESNRLPNCKVFPIDVSDIKDRDLILKKPCGYFFD